MTGTVEQETTIPTEEEIKNLAQEILPGKQIVIVDDEETLGSLVKRHLERLGANQVTVFLNGKDALKAITEKRPDILVTDQRMPEMKGLELAQNVNKEGAEQKIPIIMMSGDIGEIEPKTIEEAIKSGTITKFVDKTFKSFLIDIIYPICQELQNSENTDS